MGSLFSWQGWAGVRGTGEITGMGKILKEIAMNMIPQTRQIIIVCLGLIGLGTVAAWGLSAIRTEDAFVIVLPIITGFFTLLKGEQ
jgi:hypothetical protein